MGVVSILIRDSRAEGPASRIKGSSKDSKIKAPRTEVPARQRSATPPPQRGVSPQSAVSGSEMLRDALSAHEEFEGTINDPIEVATPDREVRMVEAVEFSTGACSPTSDHHHQSFLHNLCPSSRPSSQSDQWTSRWTRWSHIGQSKLPDLIDSGRTG